MNEIRSKMEAAQALQDGKVVNGRLELPGRETYLVPHANGDITVNYRGTDIVTYVSNGYQILLNAGSWLTLTTMKKMNAYIPKEVRIEQTEKKLWVVRAVKNNLVGYYSNGMVIDMMQDKVMGKKLQPEHIEKLLELQNSVKEYVNTYMEVLSAGQLYDQDDVESLAVTSTEYQRGTVDYLTPVQANRIVKSAKIPPSLLERAIAIEYDEPFEMTMTRDAISFDKGNWTFRTADDHNKYFKLARRALKRLLNKSLELPINS